jgi:hypothetical protein
MSEYRAMKKLNRLSHLVVVLILSMSAAAPPLAAGRDPRETKVLQGIQTMLTKPLTSEAIDAQAEVVQFSQTSDKTPVLITPDFYKSLESQYGPILLAYYIAGAVKYDLENPTKIGDEYASVPSAIEAMLIVYRELKKKQPDIRDSFYEQLEQLQAAGQLESYVQRKAKEKA